VDTREWRVYGLVLRLIRDREISQVGNNGLKMETLFSTDQGRNWGQAGILYSLGRFAEGLLVLLLFMGVWWWLNQFIPVGRYVQAVFVLLSLMGVCSVGVMAERLFSYRVARTQSQTFARQAAAALRNRDLDQAIAIAGLYPRSPIAKVAACGLAGFQAALPLLSAGEIIETVKQAMRRSAQVVHGDLRRGLYTLDSVASTSPLVGVFGTIFGFLGSFPGAGIEKSKYMGIVAGLIAGALLPTAFSLLVAVPTQWCCKYLRRELESFDLEMENQFVELVNYLSICLGLS
jgi:biopolymer transport protein ExbB/TolQ